MWNPENKELHQKRYLKLVIFIFSVIGILHALRLFYGWDAVIGGTVLPLGLSWFALIAAIFMVWMGTLYLRK
ncbi:MAG TPA: hypothetical protein VJC12_00945 [Candidatus Paceibacterota bacterium]